MNTTTLLHRIAAGESQTQEFKASFDKACIASLVAFEFDGIQRKERFAYPLPALREALLIIPPKNWTAP